MRRIFALLLMLIASVTLNARGWEPADPEATPQAKELFQRLLTSVFSFAPWTVLLFLVCLRRGFLRILHF